MREETKHKAHLIAALRLGGATYQELADRFQISPKYCRKLSSSVEGRAARNQIVKDMTAAVIEWRLGTLMSGHVPHVPGAAIEFFNVKIRQFTDKYESKKR